ncbi:MAG TPA: SRPBCC family protein [Acidimicrobiales bacterium]|nr:SRPBCC family protein [Acidimicrobiales bacterium]
MELTHEFRVDVPVPEAWKVLTDVEHIAPMLPGAQLQEVEGDEYRGVVKVKVGPIQAQYKGAATFVERDEAAGKVVLKASGRDTRGQGNATAVITANLTPEGDGTRVSVVTDLTVTGKVAQFGRGVMAEVSSKLLGQFVDALEADIASSGRATAATGVDEDAAPANGAGSANHPNPADTVNDGPAAGGDGSIQTEPSGPRRIDSPEAKPVDLVAVAGPSTVKRLLPVVGVVVLLLILWVRRRGHGTAGAV